MIMQSINKGKIKMDAKFLSQCFPLLMRNSGEVEIKVTGISMLPEFSEGDVITITQDSVFLPGDIIAFIYKNEGLIVHRLLKKDKKYYCKGDNSFRLEDIYLNDIIGKITKINGRKVVAWEDWKVQLSYIVNRIFVNSGYDIEMTKKSCVYKLYGELILKKERNRVRYKRNSSMEYIENDKDSLMVFDSEKEMVHFLDDAGTTILSILSNEKSIDELLEELCHVYDATIDEVRDDVERFLADAVQKDIIVTF